VNTDYIRELLRDLRRFPTEEGHRRLSNHDLLRTLPIRLRSYTWTEILECTPKDEEEINGWLRQCRNNPTAVARAIKAYHERVAERSGEQGK
jgi:hypothetical protein